MKRTKAGWRRVYDKILEILRRNLEVEEDEDKATRLEEEIEHVEKARKRRLRFWKRN